MRGVRCSIRSEERRVGDSKPSASASTVVEEIMDEARARAFALTSPKEDLMATKRRYVVSPSASIALAGILAIARAKAAANLAPQEAAILVKNNKATEKGKSSGDNNKSVSLLSLLTRILAKAKAEAEEDARDEVEEWTIEKRDAAVRGEKICSKKCSVKRTRLLPYLGTPMPRDLLERWRRYLMTRMVVSLSALTIY